jgi:hypothetical protein
LWNEDESKNIERLVLEGKSEKKMDNSKLLLDGIPRSALGYEFTLEKVKNQTYNDANSSFISNYWNKQIHYAS